MFTRSPGRFVEGPTNHNIRQRRDRDGQVVIEKQTRSLWGTEFGRWERDKNEINHQRARHRAEEQSKR